MTVIARKNGRAIHECVVKCGECGAKMNLKRSKHGYFYSCSKFPDCRGSHGAHANGKPLGIPADNKTKTRRIIAHRHFDKLWGEGSISRDQAYQWLQKEMDMTEKQCHIGRFSLDECDRVIGIVRKFLREEK